MLLLVFPRFLDRLRDFVIALAPLPPATAGFPTPSRVWVSFAFLVRVGMGAGSGSDCG